MMTVHRRGVPRSGEEPKTARARRAAAVTAAAVLGGGMWLAPAAQAGVAAVVPVPCSGSDLAAAFSAATPGTVLSLAAGCSYPVSAGLTAAVNMTVQGDGATIAAAASGFTLLTVNGGVAATISRLTFTGASSSAIVNFGRLRVRASDFTGNSAPGSSGQGGAINDYGRLTVRNSTFTGNSAGLFGGAITSASGKMSIFHSRFTGNSSDIGGAVANANGTPLQVSFSRFSGNTGSLGGAVFDNGKTTVTGSIFSRNSGGTGGAIYNLITPLTLTGTLVNGNTAPNGGQGGGIFNTGKLTLLDSTVLHNTATTGGDGGGIYNYSGGTVTLVTSTVVRNHPDNCAPVGTITGCTG